ncbi:MAG: hypothetical protein KBA46_00855 [Candidatus Omnitrophica bacterium]|nr:hypothetical protein [Candidatus Omnitrophota bacterium]
MVSCYLFIGNDLAIQLQHITKLKASFFAKDVEQFNYEVIFGRELTLNQLQEKLRCLPVKAKKRIVILKEADALKDEVREFIARFVQQPYPHVVLVLIANHISPKDTFLSAVSRFAHVIRAKEVFTPDAFLLGRQIEAGRFDYALRSLNQLLQNGEKPERILGGLRYSWEKNLASLPERKKRLRLLLQCDIDIKTGRLAPAFALEKLVVGLCGLGKKLDQT